MGKLVYSQEEIEIEDRALAHLKVVITTKLRREESFTLSWRHADDQPRGRSTIWLHPTIQLRFVFSGEEPIELSRKWLDALAQSANSTSGIMLVAEPAPDGEGEQIVLPVGDDENPHNDAVR